MIEPARGDRHRSSAGHRTALVVLVIVAAVGAGACSASDSAATDAAGTSTTFASSTTTSSRILGDDVTETTVPPDDGGGLVPPGCTPATTDNLASMNARLTEVAGQVDEAFVVRHGGATYLAANVYGTTGDRIADGAVWVMVDSLWYALSDSAQEYSTWPIAARSDGGPRIDDPGSIEVLQCTTIATPTG